MALRLSTTVLLSALISAAVPTAGSDLAYTPYVNHRYQYAISYPAAILIPQDEPDSGDGQTFLSKGGDVEMSVWGSYNALDETIWSRFRDRTRSAAKKEPAREVTFKHLGKDWFVVSGFRGEKIFYEKTILKGIVFITVHLSYPAAAKAVWDPIVETISKSLQHSRSRSPQ